jgi:hypothetical protein
MYPKAGYELTVTKLASQPLSISCTVVWHLLFPTFGSLDKSQNSVRREMATFNILSYVADTMLLKHNISVC